MVEPVSRLLFFTLWRTRSYERADRSRLIWADRGDGIYRLSPLGLLNTGLRALDLQLALERQ